MHAHTFRIICVCMMCAPFIVPIIYIPHLLQYSLFISCAHWLFFWLCVERLCVCSSVFIQFEHTRTHTRQCNGLLLLVACCSIYWNMACECVCSADPAHFMLEFLVRCVSESFAMVCYSILLFDRPVVVWLLISNVMISLPYYKCVRFDFVFN